VPPAVALLNYISSGILWRIFPKLGHFAGFTLHTIDFAVRNSEAAMGGVVDISNLKATVVLGALHADGELKSVHIQYKG
jgi:hypothetical protein